CPSYMLQQNVSKDHYNGFYSCGLSKDQAQQAANNNTVNHRLGKLLTHLDQQKVAAPFNWEQFYDSKAEDVHRQDVVIAGHSEGGATATWIVKNKNVRAGLTFEAPYSDLALDNTADPKNEDTAKRFTPCYSPVACPYKNGSDGKTYTEKF